MKFKRRPTEVFAGQFKEADPFFPWGATRDEQGRPAIKLGNGTFQQLSDGDWVVSGTSGEEIVKPEVFASEFAKLTDTVDDSNPCGFDPDLLWDMAKELPAGSARDDLLAVIDAMKPLLPLVRAMEWKRTSSKDYKWDGAGNTPDSQITDAVNQYQFYYGRATHLRRSIQFGMVEEEA